MAAMILIRLTPAEDLLKVTDRFPVRLIRAWSLSLGGSPTEDTESSPMVSPGAVKSLQPALQFSHPALLSTGATTLVSADTVLAQMCQRTGRQRRRSSQTGLSLENWSLLLLYLSLCLQLKGERDNCGISSFEATVSGRLSSLPPGSLAVLGCGVMCC